MLIDACGVLFCDDMAFTSFGRSKSDSIKHGTEGMRLMATPWDSPSSTFPCTLYIRQCLSHLQDQSHQRALALLHRHLLDAQWAASQSRRVRFGEPALYNDICANAAANG